MPAPEIDIVVDDPTAPASDSPAVTTTRRVEVVVYLLLLALALLLGFDNWKSGMGWAKDGPQSGYVPFYLCVILAGASLWGLGAVFARRGRASWTFVTRDQLRRVTQVFIPTFLFCLFTQWLGLYVASFLLVAGFMRIVGRIALVEVAAHERPVRRHHVRRRSTSRSTSSCPRGRSNELSAASHGGADSPAARFRRPPDVEDSDDDGHRPPARHLRRRAAGTGRAERGRDPAAAHVHDGPDHRDRDAFVHLLGRAVRRRDHLDPVQHSGRGVVGGHHLRRLSDGAAGEGRGGAHRGVHVVVHRLAGRGAADHLSRAPHRVVRPAVRAA